MMTNPLSTAPTSSFTIIIFDTSGYIINQLLSGLTITMTIPASFSLMTVNPTSKTNGALTTYTITLAQPSAISQNSVLKIYFPT
jgi:hypothetical protein